MDVKNLYLLLGHNSIHNTTLNNLHSLIDYQEPTNMDPSFKALIIIQMRHKAPRDQATKMGEAWLQKNLNKLGLL